MENTMTMSKSYEQKMLERRSELFEQARGDEALEKRRENIKQFHLGHGRYQAVVFPEPVHYPGRRRRVEGHRQHTSRTRRTPQAGPSFATAPTRCAWS